MKAWIQKHTIIATLIPVLLVMLMIFCFSAQNGQESGQLSGQITRAVVRLFVPEFALKPGVEIRANCYKCGDLTPKPHYLSWNPVVNPTPDFHRSCDFGAMILE